MHDQLSNYICRKIVWRCNLNPKMGGKLDCLPEGKEAKCTCRGQVLQNMLVLVRRGSHFHEVTKKESYRHHESK